MSEKDEMIKKIYNLLSEDCEALDLDYYYNLEGDYVVSYKQGGKKYLITIEEID